MYQLVLQPRERFTNTQGHCGNKRKEGHTNDPHVSLPLLQRQQMLYHQGLFDVRRYG